MLILTLVVSVDNMAKKTTKKEVKEPEVVAPVVEPVVKVKLTGLQRAEIQRLKREAK
jgi:hypothetical protein